MRDDGARLMRKEKVLTEREMRLGTPQASPQCYLTGQEHSIIKDLRRNNSITIKPSEQSKGFVAMATDRYIEKLNSILDCKASYEECNIAVGDLDRESAGVTKDIKTGKISPSLARALPPHNSRMPVFYGLPKDHKSGLPLRPVFSSYGSPTSNISLLLEQILNQLLKFVPAHLSCTVDCIAALNATSDLPQDCIVASLDVVSLYSNIPINESVDAAIELLEEHRAEIDMFSLSVSDIHDLLLFVLNSNFFEFNGNVYRQRLGLAMGNHLVPPMAIIFMSRLESLALSDFPLKPLLYLRYIDDCIIIRLFGVALFLQFVEHLNSRHPHIRFTTDYTRSANSHTISYLDLSISCSSGNCWIGSGLSSRLTVVFTWRTCRPCRWTQKSS